MKSTLDGKTNDTMWKRRVQKASINLKKSIILPFFYFLVINIFRTKTDNLRPFVMEGHKLKMYRIIGMNGYILHARCAAYGAEEDQCGNTL